MAEFVLIWFGKKNYAPREKYAHIKIKNILFAKNFVYVPLNLEFLQVNYISVKLYI